jgi:hypothetical protein
VTPPEAWTVPAPRPLASLPCPNPECGRILARTDGERLIMDASYTVKTTTLHCTRPGCSGRVTWAPGGGRRGGRGGGYSY